MLISLKSIILLSCEEGQLKTGNLWDIIAFQILKLSLVVAGNGKELEGKSIRRSSDHGIEALRQ